ncbi:hypothetical protein ABZY05_37290 [Streptomyces canus]|uniref:hypothetical protein n=1 Tax=Streptomyces canus TaxID=58343 RepID=UPI0033B17003
MTPCHTEALDNLLADGCTLTHITGYVRPKDEWLSQMRAGLARVPYTVASVMKRPETRAVLQLAAADDHGLRPRRRHMVRGPLGRHDLVSGR